MVLLSGRPGLLSGSLCGPHGSPRRCLTAADHCAWAGGGGEFGLSVRTCVRLIDGHRMVTHCGPSQLGLERKMSDTCSRARAGSGRAFQGFILLQKAWLHMKPSIHLNLPPLQPELAVFLRPAAPLPPPPSLQLLGWRMTDAVITPGSQSDPAADGWRQTQCDTASSIWFLMHRLHFRWLRGA